MIIIPNHNLKDTNPNHNSKKEDYFSKLPVEIIQEIFYKLSNQDIFSLSLMNREFYECAKDFNNKIKKIKKNIIIYNLEDLKNLVNEIKELIKCNTSIPPTTKKSITEKLDTLIEPKIFKKFEQEKNLNTDKIRPYDFPYEYVTPVLQNILAIVSELNFDSYLTSDNLFLKLEKTSVFFKNNKIEKWAAYFFVEREYFDFDGDGDGDDSLSKVIIKNWIEKGDSGIKDAIDLATVLSTKYKIEYLPCNELIVDYLTKSGNIIAAANFLLKLNDPLEEFNYSTVNLFFDNILTSNTSKPLKEESNAVQLVFNLVKNDDGYELNLNNLGIELDSGDLSKNTLLDKLKSAGYDIS